MTSADDIPKEQWAQVVENKGGRTPSPLGPCSARAA